MDVTFLRHQRWRDFYELYGVELRHEPNAQGWVNFKCDLPTHDKADKGEHGAVNVISGNYRCWSESCRKRYAAKLKKPEGSQVLTPREFLILSQRMSSDQAERVVESYRLSHLESSEKQVYYDDFTKAYTPSGELTEFVEAAQKRLSPDLDIVVEYLRTRHLDYETLVEAGAGYVPESDDQEECLILPYYLDGIVVGVRGRTIDGRKGGIKHSYSCLYNLQALTKATSRTCVIVEGETDTLFLSQVLRGRGIPVFGTPGIHFKPEWARHLQPFTRILAIPQADEAALNFKSDLRELFPDRLELVALPWTATSWGKDIVDFTAQFGDDALVNVLGLTEDDFESRPRLLNGPALMALSKVEIPWLIPGLLERGTKTLLVGEPKTYKTWIALQLMTCVTRMEPFLGDADWVPREKGLRALLVEEEGSPYRLGQRLVLMSKNPSPDLWVIHRQGVRLDDDESLAQLRQNVLQVRPDLLVLDPYANLHMQDENSAQGTMIVMNALNNLLRAHPKMAIVLIHHTPKGGKGARGSGALWGAVDTQILVERTTLGIRMEIAGRDLADEKSNGMEFVFDPGTGRHKPYGGVTLSGKEKPKTGSAAEEILSILQDADEGLTRDELMSLLPGCSSHAIYTALKGLEEEGLVTTSGSGQRGDPKTYYAREGS